MPLLSHENITLRAVEPKDLDTLYRWENDTDLWQVGSTVEPYSRYQIEAFIARARQDIFEAKQLRLMIDDITGKAGEAKTVGCIDIYDFDPLHLRAAVGILVSSEEQRRGIAARALQLVAGYCFNFLKMHQLYCYIPAENEASIKLFEKEGFMRSGTLHDWLRTADGYKQVYLYQLVR